MTLRLLPAFAALLCAHSTFAEIIYKVDFSSGSPGDDVVTAENAIPASFPGKQITFVTKSPDVTFKLAGSRRPSQAVRSPYRYGKVQQQFLPAVGGRCGGQGDFLRGAEGDLDDEL